MYPLNLPRLHRQGMKPGEEPETGCKVLHYSVFVKLALFVAAAVTDDFFIFLSFIYKFPGIITAGKTK